MSDQYHQENENSEPSQPSGESSTPPEAAVTPPVVDAQQLETNSDAKTWGMLAHLSALVSLVGIPSFIGPLVIWLIKKEEYSFVNEQGKESLNFQITIMIAVLICVPLCFICIGFFLLLGVAIGGLILTIIAAVKASSGEHYRYPWCLRLVK